MVLNVLLGLSATELDAFYVQNTFYNSAKLLASLGTGNVRVGLFLLSQLPPITPDAWTPSRGAKDNSLLQLVKPGPRQRSIF